MTPLLRRSGVVLSCLTFCVAAMTPHAAWSAGDPQRGKVIYEKNCAGCHGRSGAGLEGATPNLADRSRMATTTDAELFQTVTNGRPGTGMPAWEKVLSVGDRWNVVAYVRSLAGSP